MLDGEADSSFLLRQVIQYILPPIEEGERKKKSKVRRCCVGEEFIQFLAALAILHKDDFKNRMNSSFSLISSCYSKWYYAKQLAR